MRKFFFLLLACTIGHAGYTQNLEWAKNIGLPYASQVEPDELGNICVVGTYSGTVDINPGTGVSMITATANTSSYMLKLDVNGNFLSGKNIGNTPVTDIAFDRSGNSYHIGTFVDTVDFDPGPAEYKLGSNGQTDIVIVKLDATGNFLWATSVGGTFNDQVPSLTVDSTGNVYYTGWFWLTVDFDPGAAVQELTALGSHYDVFISKLDTDGNFIWAKQVGGAVSTFSYDITLDQAGNVYTTGGFIADTDFDPSPDTYTLLASGSIDIFVLKLDNAGSFVWAKNMGAPTATANDRGRCITVDSNGDVYTLGVFDPGADFDPGPATFYLNGANPQITFISKLDNNGNFVWAKKIEHGLSVNNMDIGLDSLHNIYISASYSQTIDVDPGPATHSFTSNGSADITNIKLDSAGNFIWAITVGGTGIEYCFDSYIDNVGNSYLVGGFRGTVDFDPGGAVYNLIDTFPTLQNGFVLKLGLSALPIQLAGFEVSKDKNDAFLAWHTSSEFNTRTFEIERSEDARPFKKIGEVNAAGNSNITRAYHFRDFDAGKNFHGKEIYYRLKQIDLDGKFSYSPVRSVKFDDNFFINIYPNPAIDLVTIETTESGIGLSYTITDALGKLVTSGQLKISKTIIDVSRFARGIYYVQVGKNKAVKLVRR